MEETEKRILIMERESNIVAKSSLDIHSQQILDSLSLGKDQYSTFYYIHNIVFCKDNLDPHLTHF